MGTCCSAEAPSATCRLYLFPFSTKKAHFFKNNKQKPFPFPFVLGLATSNEMADIVCLNAKLEEISAAEQYQVEWYCRMLQSCSATERLGSKM